MDTSQDVHVHVLDGLVVVVDDSGKVNKNDTDKKDPASESRTTSDSQPDLTVRGDELKEAGKLQKVAQALEEAHMDAQADVVKEHVRNIVAKELNELDGFDR